MKASSHRYVSECRSPQTPTCSSNPLYNFTLHYHKEKLRWRHSAAGRYVSQCRSPHEPYEVGWRVTDHLTRRQNNLQSSSMHLHMCSWSKLQTPVYPVRGFTIQMFSVHSDIHIHHPSVRSTFGYRISQFKCSLYIKFTIHKTLKFLAHITLHTFQASIIVRQRGFGRLATGTVVQSWCPSAATATVAYHRYFAGPCRVYN